MPPLREAFFLVKECGLVGVEFFEDSSHERLSNESTPIGYPIFLAEPIEGTLFVLVQQDGYSIFSWRFFCHNWYY